MAHFPSYISICHQQFAALLNCCFWKKQGDSLSKLQEMCKARRCITVWHTVKIWHLFHSALALMLAWWIRWHSEDTQVVYVCMKSKLDQIIPLHANPTTLWQSSLIPAQPLNFNPNQMFFFFFHCITRVIQHKLSSWLPGFKQAPI